MELYYGFTSRCPLNTLLPAVVLLTSYVGSLMVTVPSGSLVALRGQSVILGCEFSPDLGPSYDLSSLVVTWQRQEDSRVVHSFYYERDQLNQQDPSYHNRTALFVTELAKGNASLRIDSVGHQDMGRFLCTVSTAKGTDKAELQVNYGALYTEPRLSISMTSGNVTVQYETEGFPKPEVKWRDAKGQDLIDHQELIEKVGLFYLKSSYVSNTLALNVTFVLRNKPLNQDMLRLVNFSIAGGNSSCAHTTFTVICVILLVMLLIAVLIIGWCYWQKKK